MVGEIISKGKNEREYMVRDHNGRTLHTNSRFVKQRHDSAQIALPTGNVKAQMPTPRTTRSIQMMPTGMPEPRPIHERKPRVRFTVEDKNDCQRAMRRLCQSTDNQSNHSPGNSWPEKERKKREMIIHEVESIWYYFNSFCLIYFWCISIPGNGIKCLTCTVNGSM